MAALVECDPTLGARVLISMQDTVANSLAKTKRVSMSPWSNVVGFDRQCTIVKTMHSRF